MTAALLWLGWAGTAAAQRTDFLVNDDGSSAEQNHPRIAVSGDGGFVIAWVDRRNSSADIYLQRFASDGYPTGANIIVNDDAGTAYQTAPAIGVDLTGLYSVVWRDYRNGSYPFGPAVYFQRYDTTLAPVDTNLTLTLNEPDSLKESPDIALSPWGGGLVVWADYRNLNWDVYGQLIASNGSMMGSNFRINDDAGSAQQHAPRVAVSPEGWLVVTWYDNREGNDDIFVQRFDSLANPLGGNVRINSDTDGKRQAFPDVATDGAGHFTVVWVDWRNGVYPSNPDIYARKFDTAMTPVTDDEQVNQDGSTRAQREPCIAADRRGNVAIIWSDSTGSANLYDITGQMIDVDGVIREVNFGANTDADSSQLHADVALDGLYRYITWADKRNGNYDIYASITQYNDPTLAPNPDNFRFEMLAGGAVPASQSLQVDHYGFNSLNFDVLSSHDWLDVTPSSGSTPATIDVSIATDTLPFGTYFGSLTLHDTDGDDSTVQIPVRLDVSAPTLDLSADTLSFTVFAGADDSTGRSLIIANGGAGDLNWTINEAITWLTVSTTSGTNGGTVDVWVNGETFSAGIVLDSFEVEAGSAVNSPATVWVQVEAFDNQPYLRLNPDSLRIVTESPASAGAYTVVANAGAGSLDWSVSGGDAWLNLDRTTGTDDDTIFVTIDTSGLGPGLHTTYFNVVDSAAFQPAERLTFVLDYLTASLDTVLVNSVRTTTAASDSLAVELVLVNSARQLEIPLYYDNSLIDIDSVRFDSGLPGYMVSCSSDDASRGVVTLAAASDDPVSSLVSGTHDLATVYFTTGSTTGLFEMGEPVFTDLACVIVTSNGSRLHPITLPGEVRVDDPTPVEIEPGFGLPTDYRLVQNYPNPVNPSTTIEFQLPILSDIELAIFNILGQRVRTLVKERLPAGEYKLGWDGSFADGRSAPSGIYFYRLTAGEISRVRKMVLLK